MDEEQDDKQEEQGAQGALKQVAKGAEEAGKKLAKTGGKRIGAWIMGTIGVMGILKFIALILIIVIASSIFSSLYYYFHDKVAEEVSKISDTVYENYEIDEDGIRFHKEELLEDLETWLKDNGVDVQSLGLGDSTVDPITGTSQATEYLYKYITATMATELPYIKGSDKEAVGIVHIYRKMIDLVGKTKEELTQEELEKAVAAEPVELEYIGLKKLQQMQEEGNKDVLKYYSLDDMWNICIVKPIYSGYNEIVYENLTDAAPPINDVQTTYKMVTIPYRSTVSQYAMSLDFLFRLLQVTQSAEYVSAVADLNLVGGRIDYTIFDSVTRTDYSKVYSYDLLEQKKIANIPTYEEVQQGITSYRIVQENKTMTEITTKMEQEDMIKGNVTRAKTWFIDQTTTYTATIQPQKITMEENYDNTSAGYEDQNPPDGDTEGSWKSNQRLHVVEKKTSVTWDKEADTVTQINPDQFLGLWKNTTGEYEYGAAFDPAGKTVAYPILPGKTKTLIPITNIIPSQEILYNALYKKEETQMQAEMLRYCLALYQGKGEEQNIKFDGYFDPTEFIEGTYRNRECS